MRHTPHNLWRNFRFLHLCHVKKFEISPHVEKLQNSPHLSRLEIWNFFTWQIFCPPIYRWYIGDKGDKYEVWSVCPTKEQKNLAAIYKKFYKGRQIVLSIKQYGNNIYTEVHFLYVGHVIHILLSNCLIVILSNCHFAEISSLND